MHNTPKLAGNFSEMCNFFLTSVVQEWWCACKERLLPGKASLEHPSCGVCCLCCLTLTLFSSTPASLALIWCGKTQLECCLMRMAAPWLLGSDGCGNGPGYQIFCGVVLGQALRIRVRICFRAICGIHLAQLWSNLIKL